MESPVTDLPPQNEHSLWGTTRHTQPVLTAIPQQRWCIAVPAFLCICGSLWAFTDTYVAMAAALLCVRVRVRVLVAVVLFTREEERAKESRR